jgi:hypothetical protein
MIDPFISSYRRLSNRVCTDGIKIRKEGGVARHIYKVLVED